MSLLPVPLGFIALWEVVDSLRDTVNDIPTCVAVAHIVKLTRYQTGWPYTRVLCSSGQEFLVAEDINVIQQRIEVAYVKLAEANRASS